LKKDYYCPHQNAPDNNNKRDLNETEPIAADQRFLHPSTKQLIFMAISRTIWQKSRKKVAN